MTDCLFCRIAASQIPADIVQRTDRVLAFRDISPRAAVHTLVIPVDHHETLADLGAADPALAGELLAFAGQIAQLEGVDESGYRLVSNVGADSGQEVPHVHLHVLGGEKLGGVAGSR